MVGNDPLIHRLEVSFSVWEKKHDFHIWTNIAYVWRMTKSIIDNTGQQRFWPMRKNVCGVFLDAEFEYISRISLSPTPFALYQTMWPQTPTYVSHWKGGGAVRGSPDMT